MGHILFQNKGFNVILTRSLVLNLGQFLYNNATQVHIFLELAGYYRHFIQLRFFNSCEFPYKSLYYLEKRPSFSRPLYFKLHLINLRNCLLLLPFWHIQITILDIDTGIHVGTVLSQIQNGEERVVARRTLNKHQIKYWTTYKELLSLHTLGSIHTFSGVDISRLTMHH